MYFPSPGWWPCWDFPSCGFHEERGTLSYEALRSLTSSTNYPFTRLMPTWRVPWHSVQTLLKGKVVKKEQEIIYHLSSCVCICTEMYIHTWLSEWFSAVCSWCSDLRLKDHGAHFSIQVINNCMLDLICMENTQLKITVSYPWTVTCIFNSGKKHRIYSYIGHNINRNTWHALWLASYPGSWVRD